MTLLNTALTRPLFALLCLVRGRNKVLSPPESIVEVLLPFMTSLGALFQIPLCFF